MQEVKALARLRICAGLSEPLLFADVISIKISCADLYPLCEQMDPDFLIV